MVRMTIAENNAALAELQYHLAKLGQGSMPLTKKAIDTGAAMVQRRWVDFANGGALKGVAERLKNPRGGYARSIRKERIGTFEHEIYSDAKIADWIENGTEDFDMNETHPFGPRSRVSKTGYGYLIVPFRWGTPNTVGFKNVMPINIYDIVSKFKKMRTKRSADSAPDNEKTPNAQTPSKMVGRAKYNKGYGRLIGEEYGNMNGMVRSKDSTGKDRSGGYFTFRIISANPKAKKWKIRKGMPARHVTRAVAEETRPAIEAMVENSIMGDLKI